MCIQKFSVGLIGEYFGHSSYLGSNNVRGAFGALDVIETPNTLNDQSIPQ